MVNDGMAGAPLGAGPTYEIRTWLTNDFGSMSREN
jgi:hypothetical protein